MKKKKIKKDIYFTFDQGLTNSNDIIMGLDLSLTHSGVIIIDSKSNLIHKESIIYKKRRKNKKDYHEIKFNVFDDVIDVKDCTTINNELDYYLRLIIIRNRIVYLIKKLKVTRIVIEGYSLGLSAKSVLAQMAEIGSVIRTAIRELNIPFDLVPPKTLKSYIANNGNAKKEEIQHSILKKYGIAFEDDNEADAFALCMLCLELGDEIKLFCTEGGPATYRKQKGV